ncbi:hypothetical protein chiPu_0017581 [Chiloscyllium punctatum]|uniref:Uncharacterized protein n=1 Tax=Chiloscyllium punctatum TaxID=137246 RepID=A0A401RH79_CHIPU|nr:hypothetical protein [Chiloscyllium punctatum]
MKCCQVALLKATKVLLSGQHTNAKSEACELGPQTKQQRGRDSKSSSHRSDPKLPDRLGMVSFIFRDKTFRIGHLHGQFQIRHTLGTETSV